MANKKNIITGGQQLLDPIFLLKKVELKDGMKVADLGCGAVGHFVIPAAKMVGEGGVSYGVDILKGALEGVRSRAKLEGLTNVETIWSNIEIYRGTKINDNSLDRVLLVNILFQTKGHHDILREAVRMLKPKGKLMVIDWKRENIPSFGPSKEKRIDRREVLASAQKLGLQLKEEFEAGRYHFGLIFDNQDTTMEENI